MMSLFLVIVVMLIHVLVIILTGLKIGLNLVI